MTLASSALRVARALPQAWRRGARSSGLVLAYHRTATLDSDPQRLAVTPSQFAQHLEVLRAHCRPMPLRELIELATSARLPDRAVAVTFDDGYADNAEEARPLLERYGIAATFFIATSYLGGGREFWWDDLERHLLTPGRLPERLGLRIAGAGHAWDLKGVSTYTAEDCRRHAAWNVEHREDPTQRHTVYRRLVETLRTVSCEQRDAVLRDLADAAAGVAAPRETHRVLNEAGVAGLARGGLFEIGAHTASHPRLSARPPDEQRREIAASKARLQEVTALDVTSFAYPYGTTSDFTPDTIALVREWGFESACSTRPGLVGAKSDRFQVPRVLVRNWDAAAFAGRLRNWFGDDTVQAVT